MPQYPTLRAQISATITQHPPEKKNKTDRAHGSQLGPARMIAESLTSKPGIREHNRGQSGKTYARSESYRF